MGANEIEQSYNGGDIIPIYTSDQLEKVGSGESVYVAETGKIYTFSDDKSYLFYGQSEDLTAILNELIDQRLSELTGSSTGKSTLLWEYETTSGSSTVYNEITLQVENLDKYKYLYIEIHQNNNEEWIPMSNASFVPMHVLKEDNSNYHGAAKMFSIKYVDNNLNIQYMEHNSITHKYKLYGIE